MKRTFKILWLFGVLIGIPALLSMDENSNEPLRLDGIWEFEKVEYLEKASLDDEYESKYVIEDVKGLDALSSCYSDLVKNISVLGEIAIVECLYVKYYGRYMQSEIETSTGKEIHLTVGSPEEIDMEYEPGIMLNAPGLKYLVHRIDEYTISITVEHTCYDHAEETYGAVRSLLRKL